MQDEGSRPDEVVTQGGAGAQGPGPLRGFRGSDGTELVSFAPIGPDGVTAGVFGTSGSIATPPDLNGDAVELDVGPGFAGAPYLLLGSSTGVGPPTVLDGLAVPLVPFVAE